jgi:DNA-binding MarR family transcriptional regulator
MAGHQGPDGPDPMRSAAVDDAAPALLATWDAAREQASHRLSTPQLSALLAVERDEGINLRGLAGRLNMILSSASRLCDRLVAAGLVERVPGRVDRREIALYLTPSSRQLLDELRATRRAMLGRVLDRMSPAGRAALIRGLTEFAAAAQEPGASESARTA